MQPAGPTDELLNAALEFATEWGENYGKPINERILTKYPGLTDDQIASLTEQSWEAEHYIYNLAERELAGEITEDDIVPEALQKFSWLNADNAYRLKSIGMFYARK